MIGCEDICLEFTASRACVSELVLRMISSSKQADLGNTKPAHKRERWASALGSLAMPSCSMTPASTSSNFSRVSENRGDERQHRCLRTRATVPTRYCKAMLCCSSCEDDASLNEYTTLGTVTSRDEPRPICHAGQAGQKPYGKLHVVSAGRFLVRAQGK